MKSLACLAATVILAGCGGDFTSPVSDDVLLPWRGLNLDTGEIGAVPVGTQPTERIIVFRRVPSGSRGVHSGDTVGEAGVQDGSAASATVAKDVWMCVHELSQAQWRRLAGRAGMNLVAEPWTDVTPASAGGSGSVGDSLPAWGIDALTAAAVLTSYPGGPASITLRLPSASEWESAARSPQGSGRFGWGDAATPDAASGYARVRETSSDQKPRAIASGRALDGWYDLHGNVWEWVSDGGSHHLRGGSWCDPLAVADSGNRRDPGEDIPYALAGVRPVMVLP